MSFRKNDSQQMTPSSYIRQNDICTASFPKELCANCLHKDQCHAKIFKRVAKITVTKKAVIRARLQAEMKTDVYKNYGRFRNGVETIPSMLRNVFHTDRMPVRGKLRSKLFFGSKIGALNFRKLFRYRKGIGGVMPIIRFLNKKSPYSLIFCHSKVLSIVYGDKE